MSFQLLRTTASLYHWNVTATVTGLVGYDGLTKGEEVTAFVDGKPQS